MSGFKTQLLGLLFLWLVFPAYAQQPLKYESNQSVWLLNSNNKFASALDSIIDRSFFEAQTVTIQSLETIPLDAIYECYAYDIDTAKTGISPKMTAYFTGPQLDPRVLKRILSYKNGTLFLLLILGNKEGEEYKFIGSMKFQLKGELKQTKETQKRKKEYYTLSNSKGQKITSRDTLVSKKYFQKDWVDLSFGNEPDSSIEYWVIVQPPGADAKGFKMNGRRLMEDARKSIANEAVGTQVFFMRQQPTPDQVLMIKFSLVD